MSLETLQIGMEWFAEFPGGLNRVYANLLHQFALQGLQSEAWVSGSPDVSRLSDGLARAYASPQSPIASRLFALRRATLPWLRSHGDESVIVSHFAPHALPILDYARKRPFVVHFQGPWGEESRVEGDSNFSANVKEMLEGRVYRCADAAIVLSSSFAEILSNRFGIAREKIHVVPGGVDAERFDVAESRGEARALLGWPNDRPIVVCVRRLVKRVGIEMLVDAAGELRARVPDVLVHIVGAGPLRSQIAARIAALGLSDTVKLMGFLAEDDLPFAYRAADLSVVPTIALEGFGLITVESLAAGTPCIVTPVDGLSEIVTPFAPQLIAQRAEKHAVATTLADALRGEIAVPSSQECATYARSQFDWPVIAARVRQVYERVAT